MTKAELIAHIDTLQSIATEVVYENESCPINLAKLYTYSAAMNLEYAITELRRIIDENLELSDD